MKFFYFFLLLSLVLPKTGISQADDLSMDVYGGSSIPNAAVYYYPTARNHVPNGNLNSYWFSGTSSCDVNYSSWQWASGNGSWTSSSSTGCTATPMGIVDVYLNDITHWPYQMRWYQEKNDYTPLMSMSSLTNTGVLVFKPVEFVSGNARRHYVLFKLTKPLAPGHNYVFNIEYSSTRPSASSSQLRMDKLQAVLSDTLPVPTYGQFLDNMSPFFSTADSALIGYGAINYMDTIVGTGQKYLIIGSFAQLSDIYFSHTPASNSNAEIVIDNVFLYDADCQMEMHTPVQIHYTSVTGRRLVLMVDQHRQLAVCGSGMAIQ